MPAAVRLLAIVLALAAAVSAEDNPLRAQWVPAAALQSPEAVRRMVAAAAASGHDTLFVPARGPADGFDPLMEAVEAARERGLRVHAWLDVNLAARAGDLPASRDHVIYRHPEWLMVPRELAIELLPIDARSPDYLGRLARWTRANAPDVDGLYVSPLHAGAHALLADLVRDLVARYAVDGVHLDAVRFPAGDFDYSRGALAAFRAEIRPRLPAAQRARLDAMEVVDPFAYPVELADDWTRFRQAQLTALVTRLRTAAKSVRPGVVVSAAVIPDAAGVAAAAFQDWRTWLDNGFVDALATRAARADEVRALAGGRPVWVRD